MKICFVKLNAPWMEHQFSDPPLGLLYTMAATEEVGYEVVLLDLGWDNVIPEADVYGISATSFEYDRACEIAREIKVRFPEAKIVLGGIHASLFGEILVHQWLFDMIYVGEGEKFPEFLAHWPKTGYGVASPINRLDGISFPARHYLKKDLYFSAPTIFRGERFGLGTSTTMITSRGCPYSCAFCASPQLWGNQVRFRSALNVLEEVDELIREYNAKELRFQDDNMTLRKSRLKEICDGLRDRSIYWRCSTRTDLVTADLLKILWNGGCREIGFGVESAENEVLKLMKKGVTVKQHLGGIKLAKQFGFRTRVFMITGLPGETAKSADKAIDFLEEVNPEVVTLTTFVPVPGSEIWRNPDAFGGRILSTDFSKYDISLKKERSIPFVFSNGLSLDQMEVNREKLKRYVFNKGISNVFAYNQPYG